MRAVDESAQYEAVPAAVPFTSQTQPPRTAADPIPAVPPRPLRFEPQTFVDGPTTLERAWLQLLRYAPRIIPRLWARMHWSRQWDRIDGFMRRAAVGEAMAHLRALEVRGVIHEVIGEPSRFEMVRSG